MFCEVINNLVGDPDQDQLTFNSRFCLSGEPYAVKVARPVRERGVDTLSFHIITEGGGGWSSSFILNVYVLVQPMF